MRGGRGLGLCGGGIQAEGTLKSRRRKVGVETEKKAVSQEPKNVFRCFTYWKRSPNILYWSKASSNHNVRVVI